MRLLKKTCILTHMPQNLLTTIQYVNFLIMIHEQDSNLFLDQITTIQFDLLISVASIHKGTYFNQYGSHVNLLREKNDCFFITVSQLIIVPIYSRSCLQSTHDLIDINFYFLGPTLLCTHMYPIANVYFSLHVLLTISLSNRIGLSWNW